MALLDELALPPLAADEYGSPVPGAGYPPAPPSPTAAAAPAPAKVRLMDLGRYSDPLSAASGAVAQPPPYSPRAPWSPPLASSSPATPATPGVLAATSAFASLRGQALDLDTAATIAAAHAPGVPDPVRRSTLASLATAPAPFARPAAATPPAPALPTSDDDEALDEDAPDAPPAVEDPAQAQRNYRANLRYFKSQGGVTEVTPTGQVQPRYDAQGAPVYGPTKEERAAQAQARRDNTANLRVQRSQGVAMAPTPTGQIAPVYDDQGNTTYRPAVLAPITRLEDGRAYRVTRDNYGNQHHFDLDRDGEDGQDFHTDPRSGERFVTVAGADGGSRREVIGQNPLVPMFHAARETLDGHRAERADADNAIARAHAGQQGGEGLAALPLAALHKRAATMTDVRDAQAYLDQVAAGQLPGRALTQEHLGNAYRRAQAVVAQFGPQAAALDDEIQRRESTISEANQHRVAARENLAAASRLYVFLHTARQGTPAVRQELAALLTGGEVSDERADLHRQAGLLEDEAQPDGSTVARVSADGLRLLPANVRKAVAADPGRFNLSADALAQVQRQATPAAPTAEDAAPAPEPVAPAVLPADQTDSAPVAVQPDTPTIQPGHFADGLLAAHQAGTLESGRLKELLPLALEADRAAVEHDRLLAQDGVGSKLKAASYGLGRGAAFLAAAPAGAGIGAEIGGGIGAFFGGAGAVPGAAIGGTLGGLIAGTAGSFAADKLANELAKHSETVKSFTDAASLHPYYSAGGELIGFGAGIPKAASKAIGAGVDALANRAAAGSRIAEGLAADGSRIAPTAAEVSATMKAARASGAGIVDAAGEAIQPGAKDYLAKGLNAVAEGYKSGGGGLASTVSNLAQEASVRAAAGASTADIAKIIGLKVGGASAGMVALDTALKEGQRALGLSDEHQTLGGAAQAALMGAFISGHGIVVPETSTPELSSVLMRAYTRLASGVELDRPLQPEKLPPGMDIHAAGAVAKPLTPREMVMVGSFEDQVRALQNQGKLPADDIAARDIARRGATGREVLQNGQRQATAVTIKLPEGARLRQALPPQLRTKLLPHLIRLFPSLRKHIPKQRSALFQLLRLLLLLLRLRLTFCLLSGLLPLLPSFPKKQRHCRALAGRRRPVKHRSARTSVRRLTLKATSWT